MEFGWLRVGVVDFLGQTFGLNHHGVEPVLAPAALIALVLVLAAGTNVWRRRRRRVAQTEAASIRDEAARLKVRLRQRLYEPASLFASGINTAPTWEPAKPSRAISRRWRTRFWWRREDIAPRPGSSCASA